MKKKRIIPVIALSSALLAGTLSPIQGQAVQKQTTTEAIAQKYGIEKGNKPLFVVEKQSAMQKASTPQEALKYLENNKEKVKIKNPTASLKSTKQIEDKLGMTHVRFQQTKDGIPVEGSEVIVHFDENNAVKSVNGYYNQSVEDTAVSTTPELSGSVALSKAKKSVNAPDQLDYEPATELVIYPYDGQNYLAYKVNVNFLGEKPGNWFVFVDAKTGAVIDQYNALMHADGYKATEGTGTGILGTQRKLHTTLKNDKKDREGTEFYLYDKTHEDIEGIYTYDFKNQWRSSSVQLPGELFSDNDNSWNTQYDRPAVDAHYNSEEVYKYYKNEHGRNSIDGEGMAIKSSVHYGDNYNNAFWNGYQMTYGDGDGSFFIPLSAGLDVAAHEMTHGVTTHSAGLKYRFQSGALNEAFSDIFGALVDADDWEVGEDVMAPDAVASGRTSLRSLSDPSKYPVGSAYAPYGNGDGMYPSNMSEFYDLPVGLDNGGVHINSSIINHAAYLTGEQIGKHKLGQIYYRALTVYLTADSNFSDARKALIQSAVDIYGEGSAEAVATEDGLNQVGITE
ncbi:M4 family metallopeptidase [Pseudalkalibacillus caeni]|uniref:Neutral metalloproteinase n=1 Tax=Exobacillus caeni TaxID=2574798 RepID=A0A5R9F982_9BACL|nr:M4 family metallopeptidase [Pseudalkalibacillus caeni]TLS38178.1 peptidase M4 family protein [Pseudalkalibacillus caeni]